MGTTFLKSIFVKYFINIENMHPFSQQCYTGNNTCENNFKHIPLLLKICL